MITLENIVLYSPNMNLDAKISAQRSRVIGIEMLKKYFVKFIFAVLTFLCILFFEKSFKDAWLIPSLATMVFVVPFVEEFGKFIALKYHFAGFFVAIFLGIESYLYISHSSYLLGLERVIFYRSLVCTMHLTTVYFQWMARVYSEKNHKQHHVTAAYFLSVMIHGAWNYAL